MKLAISTSSMRRMAWKAVEIVLARLQLDVPRLAGEPRAERMDALAVGLEQARHRVLRQPVDLQVGMQLAQFARDGDVAAAVPEADGGGEIERLLGFARRLGLPSSGAGMPSLRSRKSMIRALHLAGKRPSGLWPPPGMVTSSAPVSSATSLRARIGLDLVVVAVDHQHRAADLAIHRLADVERRRDRARSTVLASTGPVVSLAHSMPSSICLVECGSEKMLRTKCSAKSG